VAFTAGAWPSLLIQRLSGRPPTPIHKLGWLHSGRLSYPQPPISQRQNFLQLCVEGINSAPAIRALQKMPEFFFQSSLMCVGVLSCSVLWCWAIRALTATSLAGLRNGGGLELDIVGVVVG